MAPESRATATHERVDGYLYAAYLADRRRERVIPWGDLVEAVAWGRIADYCRDMAASMATDDDAYRFQRDKVRKPKEIPMPNEDIAALNLPSLVEASSRALPVWQEAALELALGYLSETQRVCFTMVVGGMLEAGEVAEALGISAGEVRQHVARAKKRIVQTVYPRAKVALGR